MEMHPCEAILTNVLGRRNIADLSVLYQAEAFVMISTDKAVKPTHNPKIMIGAVREYDYESLAAHLKLLIETAQTFDSEAVVGLMKKTVPEFISQNSPYEKLDRK
ncbi:hypothetical protein FACS1894160_0240 [Bacteroidia bacterium]|nr:hypothetical protein FACS1894123_11860 [Bacteroidia bacterium]GHV07522.1 hypothetical protein FACS1894160_0240 [Bacteroidia bacterium]